MLSLYSGNKDDTRTFHLYSVSEYVTCNAILALNYFTWHEKLDFFLDFFFLFAIVHFVELVTPFYKLLTCKTSCSDFWHIVLIQKFVKKKSTFCSSKCVKVLVILLHYGLRLVIKHF